MEKHSWRPIFLEVEIFKNERRSINIEDPSQHGELRSMENTKITSKE